MEGIGFLVLVATFIIAIVALNKGSKLETRLAQLKAELGKLKDELASLRDGVPLAADAPPIEAPAPEMVAEIASAPDDGIAIEAAAAEAVAEPAPAEASAPPPRRDVEGTLASRWFVWIGGAAIAIGGLLFVKYAYDNALISPTLQIILGLAAAAVLVGTGETVRRRWSRPGDFVPAALSAAGLVTAFGSVYAAYALYELVSPNTAFLGLAAVGLFAFALSRLEGPLIAALGLIGSYGAPALIPAENPSAWSFFPYLLAITVASFATLRGRPWWWLGYLALAGSLVWAALWVDARFIADDTLPIGLFALALGFVAFFGLSGAAMPPSRGPVDQRLMLGLVGLATAFFLMADVVDASDHSQLSLALFSCLAAMALAIAWFRPEVSFIAPAAALAVFLVLMVWSAVAMHVPAMDEEGYWTNVLGPEAQRFLRDMLTAGAVLTILGALGTARRRGQAAFGLMAAGSGVLFVAGAWARVSELLGEAKWAEIAAVGAVVLLAVAHGGRRRLSDKGSDWASGFALAGSALLLVFALFRLLDGIWLTLGISGLVLFYAVQAPVLAATLMGPVAAALGSLVTLRLFLSRELWEEEKGLPWGAHWPIYGYGVPAVVMLVSSRILRGAGFLRSAMTLEGLSLGLVISLIALELRVLIAGNITYDEPGFLEMAAHILTWLGAAYGLMHRQQVFSSVIATWGARLLIAGSVVAIVMFSLGSLNPLVTEEPVPGNIVFNALLLAYLAPVVMIGLIVRRLDAIGWRDVKPAAGALALLLAFVYITMETKRVYQGHLMQAESLSIAESYAYSAVWLAFALALFIAGIRLAKQYVRYAGLGVMVIVVLKVFLWDMASLEGLYRIASFVGLGLCLVGIGWLYQRFVDKPRGDAGLMRAAASGGERDS